MTTPSIFIIEGIDNTGKGTLVDTIQDHLGFHQIIKFDKPKKLSYYNDDAREYQMESFKNAFSMLEGFLSGRKVPKLIFDRFHLGELVYSPFYRGYSGDYVFDLERKLMASAFKKALASVHIRLILLLANTPENLPDDGKSFDRDKAAIEQKIFLDGFHRSAFGNKRLIAVQNSLGEFCDPNEIAEEAIS